MIKIILITIALISTFVVYCAVKVGADAERRANKTNATKDI